MNIPDLAAELEQCLRLAQRAASTGNREQFHQTEGLLPAELSTLLQEAVEMKWPFVEEKWQYKLSVTPEDKVNTADLVSQHLPQLMAFLKASIQVSEPLWAMSAIFLMDRFLYWVDGSHTLLRIAKELHKRYPETPIAPQIVIRQARVYLNTGKLQKAEYILSSLITNCGATGCWKYNRDSDHILVQAVSVQVRGQVLQKLGLWLEAVELVWASLIGFYVLPLPDKKGIGTSLGLLANLLVSMSDQDFDTFRKKPHIDLGFLGDCSHRLLCAAQAAKLAAVFSQFGSLYVLTHMVTWGSCLLSYSFSKDCPQAEKRRYIAQAKEVFENGLLTKSERDVVTSQQELHTFLKAAYCLAITNKWMFGLSDAVTAAMEACRQALALLYSYCFKEDSNKDELSSKLMAKVHYVKSLLKVKALANSDPQSFIPDSYRAMEDKPVPFAPGDFTLLMEGFQKHHKSVCDAFQTLSLKEQGREGKCTHDDCITAFQTRTESLATECGTKSAAPQPLRTEHAQKAGAFLDAQNETVGSTWDDEEQQAGEGRRRWGSDKMNESKKYGVGNSGSSQGSSGLGSSWLNIPQNAGSAVVANPFCCTEIDDDAGVDGVPVFQTNAGHCFQTSQPGVVQNQAKHELCTTLETEESTQDGNKMNIGGREVGQPEGQRHKMSSGSSLGSSWQSVSFSKSPPNGDVAETWEDERAVDQNCETVETQDGPDSPFECLDFHASPLPKIKLEGHPDAPSQNKVDVPETRNLCCPQTCNKNQGDIQTVEDLEESDLSCQLSGFSLFDECAEGGKNLNFRPEEARPGRSRLTPTLSSTEPESFELLQDFPKSLEDVDERDGGRCWSDALVTCSKKCFQDCTLGSVVLTEQDYRWFLSGVCQSCLLRRLPNTTFKLTQYNRAYGALVLKYSKATGMWTGCETSVYVGDVLQVAVKGGQRQAFRVHYLHQEQLLASYVGKEYVRARPIHTHLEDVERQMTAQFYVMEFNKSLYASDITTQIFYIPSEILLITEADRVVACVSVEPFMLGDFVKLTNNTTKTDRRYSATKYGIAFGHFTYEFSNRKEIVVDLQGWVTANGKGLAYLTDPQIHSLLKPRSSSNFHQSGITKFLRQQHRDTCGPICMAALQTLTLTRRANAQP